MINELPRCTIWSAGGIGKEQLKINALSLIAGGGVRIGIEDNIYYDYERTTLATNRDFLEQIDKVARTFDLAPYSNKEIRQVLGLV